MEQLMCSIRKETKMGDSRDGFTCNEDGTSFDSKPKKITIHTNKADYILGMSEKALAKSIVQLDKKTGKRLLKALKKELK